MSHHRYDGKMFYTRESAADPGIFVCVWVWVWVCAVLKVV